MGALSKHVNVIDVFYDKNLNLIPVYHKTGLLLKVINVFHTVKLTFFMKRTKNSQKIGRWKMTEDSRVKKSLF